MAIPRMVFPFPQVPRRDRSFDQSRQRSAAFSASAELQKAREAGAIAGPAKTQEQADAHFLSQGIGLLSTNIWVKHDGAAASVIRASAGKGGEYLEGEATPDDSCDANRVCGGNLVSKAGVEYGAASVSEFDTRGFKFIGKPEIDTNLQAGLSHPRPNLAASYRRFRFDRFRYRDGSKREETGQPFRRTLPYCRHAGDQFEQGAYQDGGQGEPLFKMENEPKGIIGAWAADPAIIKTQTYFFFSNGKFMMVDPIGDPAREGHESCGVLVSSFPHTPMIPAARR